MRAKQLAASQERLRSMSSTVAVAVVAAAAASPVRNLVTFK
jgi:hypothetical protein